MLDVLDHRTFVCLPHIIDDESGRSHGVGWNGIATGHAVGKSNEPPGIVGDIGLGVSLGAKTHWLLNIDRSG